jgi:hypothetical protein
VGAGVEDAERLGVVRRQEVVVAGFRTHAHSSLRAAVL